MYESVVAKEEEVEDKSVKKNNKGKVAGSGTVSLKRREKFQQKGQKRENEMMAKEDALTKGINWDEVLRRGNTKARKLTKQEVEFFFLPKEEREKLEKERKEKVEKEAILTKDEPAKQERKKVTLTPAKKVVALPVTISTEVQAAGAMEEGVPMEEEAPVTTHVNQGGPMEEAPVTTHVEEGCPMEGEDAPVTTHVEEGCPMEEEDAPVTTKVEKGGTMEEEDAPVTTKVEKGSPMEEEEEATEVEKEAPMEEGALKEETFLTKEEPASSSATLTKGSTETGESAPMTPPDWEEPVSNCSSSSSSPSPFRLEGAGPNKQKKNDETWPALTKGTAAPAPKPWPMPKAEGAQRPLPARKEIAVDWYNTIRLRHHIPTDNLVALNILMVHHNVHLLSFAGYDREQEVRAELAEKGLNTKFKSVTFVRQKLGKDGKAQWCLDKRMDCLIEDDDQICWECEQRKVPFYAIKTRHKPKQWCNIAFNGLPDAVKHLLSGKHHSGTF